MAVRSMKMKRNLIFVMTALVGGLVVTDFIQAQQSTSRGLQNNDSISKPCVVVLGAMRSPAWFMFNQPMRLAEIIAMAGGAKESPTAIVQILHGPASKCGRLEVEAQSCIDCRRPPLQPGVIPLHYRLSELHGEDEKANPYLQPGDVIQVLEAPPAYVMGCVIAPQGLVLKDQMTLNQAIVLTGGETHDAVVKKVTIYRQDPENPNTRQLQFDVRAIRKGRAEDPVLQPLDIIEVSCRH